MMDSRNTNTEKNQENPEVGIRSAEAKAADDRDMEYRLKLDKLKAGKGRAVRLALAATVVAILSLWGCIAVFRGYYSKTMTLVAHIGDVTFTEKKAEGDIYYVTFKAADYNRLPKDLGTQGVTVRIEEELYGVLVLNEMYSSANVVFSIPQGVAKKAGYKEAEANVSELWKPEILKEYATIRSVVWNK